MQSPKIQIVPFESDHRESVLALSLRAWRPVFAAMRDEMPGYVYEAFYPHGWEARQRRDIDAVCRDEETDVRVALSEGEVAGFVGLRAHPEDSMGVVYVIAVDPEHQHRDVGAALLDFSLSWMRERDCAIGMVETGADSGHAPSRAAYERAGFARFPVARYFREL